VTSTREDVRVQDVRRSGTEASLSISAPNGDFLGGPDRQWDVRIPSDLPVALTINVGAGNFDLDLRDVQLRSARISNGASDLTVRLPKPSGDVNVNISAGASSITLAVPQGVAYRVRTTGGLNSVNGIEESATYPTAADQFTVVISAGASSITIR
jgi:hypothetical protein